MFKIYCDETWTTSKVKAEQNYYVFYGVMVTEAYEDDLLQQIDDFKRKRGLYINDRPVEIKWVKVEEEWKNATRGQRTNRYEEFLNIFFDAFKKRTLSFGCMYLLKCEYDRVGKEFANRDSEGPHDFFFMLCYQFLFHCFIKNQVREQPCQIYIDNRDIGAPGQEYDINKLREILNKRVYRELVPKYQLSLAPEFMRKLNDSIQLINLSESKQEPLIQLADLCAGCVRYVLENTLPPPQPIYQPMLLGLDQDQAVIKPTCGREALSSVFYQKLRATKNYQNINLLMPSYHHRFNIFPFRFHR